MTGGKTLWIFNLQWFAHFTYSAWLNCSILLGPSERWVNNSHHSSGFLRLYCSKEQNATKLYFSADVLFPDKKNLVLQSGSCSGRRVSLNRQPREEINNQRLIRIRKGNQNQNQNGKSGFLTLKEEVPSSALRDDFSIYKTGCVELEVDTEQNIATCSAPRIFINKKITKHPTNPGTSSSSSSLGDLPVPVSATSIETALTRFYPRQTTQVFYIVFYFVDQLSTPLL